MVVSDRTRCELNTFIPSFLYYFDNIKIGLTLASQWDNHVHCHNLSNETSELYSYEVLYLFQYTYL